MTVLYFEQIVLTRLEDDRFQVFQLMFDFCTRKFTATCSKPLSRDNHQPHVFHF